MNTSAGVLNPGLPSGRLTIPARLQEMLTEASTEGKTLNAKLQQDNVAAAAIAGDEEFLRRVSLDLAGRIPTASEVTAFLADPTSDKRARKIDELLRSDAFVDRWTMWFGDLVQNVQVSNNSREYYLGKNAYYTFIKSSIDKHPDEQDLVAA